MDQSISQAKLRRAFSPDIFRIETLDDEIHADNRCGQLLIEFLRDLINTHNIPKEKASVMVRGADYFLRNFVISILRENIFRLRPGRVRQFGGNWYIVQNLEPNSAELESMLEGVKAFYRWAEKIGWITPLLADQIVGECSLGDYYQNRIKTFWAIEGDGFSQWDRECSIRD